MVSFSAKSFDFTNWTLQIIYVLIELADSFVIFHTKNNQSFGFKQKEFKCVCYICLFIVLVISLNQHW